MSENLPNLYKTKIIPAQLLGDIRQMIEETRAAVASTVNAGPAILYWRIGRRINRDVLEGKRDDYGKQIVATLSQQLSWSHFRELMDNDLWLDINNHKEKNNDPSQKPVLSDPDFLLHPAGVGGL
jgi:hypothetical protein